MDTMALQDVYLLMITSTAHGTFSPPTDANQWPVELILAHVIATNRTLSIVGTQILDGREATYEGGTLSVSPHWLKSIVEATEDMDGLLIALQQSSGELLALAHRFDDEAANKMFPATIYDGHGKILFDGLNSFSDLLTNKLVYHLSQHIKQIQALNTQ